jgi:hypothetical protein
MSKPRQVSFALLTSATIRELDRKAEPFILKTNRNLWAICLPVLTPNGELDIERLPPENLTSEVIDWLLRIIEGTDDA